MAKARKERCGWKWWVRYVYRVRVIKGRMKDSQQQVQQQQQQGGGRK